ncbi:MAG: ABC transporter permease [Promethearchaeota archaeon]
MVIDSLSLLLSYIHNNWKLILVSSIGLTLALAMVSETSIVVDSYRQSLFEEFFGSSDNGYTIEIITEFGVGGAEKIESNLQKMVNDLPNLGHRAATSLGYGDFIKQELWRCQFDAQIGFDELNETTYHVSIETFDNESFFSFQNFLTSGELPQYPNETIIMIEKHHEMRKTLQLKDKIRLSERSSSLERQNATAIITGIIEYDMLDYFLSPREENELWPYFGLITVSPIFITTSSNFVNYASELYENSIFFNVETYGQVDVDISQLDALNIENEKLRLAQYQHQLELEIYDVELDQWFGVAPYIIMRLELIEFQMNATINILWLFSLPTLLISFFLTTFSFSLLNRKKQQQIGTLKTRGASTRQIFVTLVGESVITTFLGMVFGIFLGIPFALLVLKSKGFLDFSGNDTPLVLTPAFFQPVLLVSILFALLINPGLVVRFSRLRINEAVVPKEKSKPFWQKFYLDVIFFAGGIIAILLVFYSNILFEPTINDPTAEIFISQISYLFGIPAPFLIAIGATLLLLRPLPKLLRLAAHLMWKLEGGIIAFSFRNILHQLAHTRRATLLVSIALVFSIALVIVPFTTDTYMVDNTYYHSLGADMIITPVRRTYGDNNESSPINYQFISNLSNYLQNLTGVASVSPIAWIESDPLYSNGLKILGIDARTFTQTAYFRDDFLNPDAWSSLLRFDLFSFLRSISRGDFFPDNPDLGTIISHLQSNTTVLMQEDNLQLRDLNVGDYFSWRFYNKTSNETRIHRFNFKIVGKFKSWPLFVSYLPIEYNDTYMVANLSSVLEYVNTSLFSLSQLSYLVRINPGISQIHLKEQIINETGYKCQCLEELVEAYYDLPTRNVLLTTVNSSLLMLITVVTFTILMYSFNQLIERGKEIGVERALGMSFKQTFVLFILEVLILILFGSIVGLVVGIFNGQFFVTTLLTLQSFIFPPFITQYPWTLIYSIMGFILISSLVISGIPAFLATQTKINKLLRTE